MRSYKQQNHQGLGASEQDALFDEDSWDLPPLDGEKFTDDDDYIDEDEDFYEDDEDCDEDDDQQHRLKKSGKRFHQKWTPKGLYDED